MERKIVIIGGGAAGGTAAQFAKKTDRKASVTIFEREKYPQYSKCALPYFISGKVKDVIEFSKEWFEKAGIELHLETTVTEIDTEKKIVIAEKDGEQIEKNYDALVIATGANSSVPPIEGVRNGDGLKKGVFSLRTLDDANSIREYLDKVDDVSIIGAGLIGLELAEAFHEKGKRVRVVEIFPQILPSMVDEDISRIVLDAIKDKVEILTGHRVKKITGENEVDGIVIEKEGEERRIETDMVILATGIKPNVDIGRKIGCKIGEKGGIVVDNRCMTSVKDIYAAGDCTEYVDLLTGKHFPVGLGSIGVRQGITAGINAAGGNASLPPGFIQTRTTRIFGVEIAAAGPLLKELGENTVHGKYTGKNLPHYFPGGKDVTVKIAVDGDGRIVSSQAVGEGSAMRINTLACAIVNGMKIDDFVQLETSYAPPIAPTLDPMILAANVVRYRYERRK